MLVRKFVAGLAIGLALFTAGGKKAEPFAIVLLLIAGHYISTWVDPSFHFPPFDTILLLELWWWCGWQVLRADDDSTSESRNEVVPGVAVGQVG